MKVAFVSGHLDLTPDEFQEHYVPKLQKAIAQNHNFVVGDARGADALTQGFLAYILPKERVKVYHMFDSPRNNVGNFPTRGGFKSDNERDSEMTRMSDYDIVWIRPGRENSGTAKNVERRTKSS
jgi:hypothetical protein